jgi:hypothetical protein
LLFVTDNKPAVAIYSSETATKIAATEQEQLFIMILPFRKRNNRGADRYASQSIQSTSTFVHYNKDSTGGRSHTLRASCKVLAKTRGVKQYARRRAALARLSEFHAPSAGGTADVGFVDGFEPEGPDTFTIVTATEGVSGEFDAISDIWISATKYLTLAHSAFDVTLSVELLGDLNGDHGVNGMDVDPFVQSMLWGPYSVNADMNHDGQVNGLDVHPFVAVVLGTGTSLTPIPEPSTIVLATMALLGAVGYVSRRKNRDV